MVTHIGASPALRHVHTERASPGKAESLRGSATGVVSVLVQLRGVRLARLKSGQLGSCLVGYDVLCLLRPVNLHAVTQRLIASSSSSSSSSSS